VNAGAEVRAAKTVTKRYEMLQKWLKKTKVLQKSRMGRRKNKFPGGGNKACEGEIDSEPKWNRAMGVGVI
jgi:hypothetical protein